MSQDVTLEQDKQRQLRDLNAYIPPKEKKKKEDVCIESYEDIVTHKPSTKKVRDYYRGVLANIVLQQQDFGEL